MLCVSIKYDIRASISKNIILTSFYIRTFGIPIYIRIFAYLIIKIFNIWKVNGMNTKPT